MIEPSSKVLSSCNSSYVLQDDLHNSPAQGQMLEYLIATASFRSLMDFTLSEAGQELRNRAGIDPSQLKEPMWQDFSRIISFP